MTTEQQVKDVLKKYDYLDPQLVLSIYQEGFQHAANIINEPKEETWSAEE